METEMYIKSIKLADSKKAKIKSKWSNDRVEIQIFVVETSSIYVGWFSQESLKKKKSTINVDYEEIKESLTSPKLKESISYELDDNKLKFSVISQEVCDSEASFGEIIYLKVDITKIEPDEMFSIATQMLEELSDAMKLQSILDQNKKDLKAMAKRFEAMSAEKVQFDESVYQKFLALLNSKKERIAKLEREAQRNRNDSNKLANLSSDFSQELTREDLKDHVSTPKSPEPSTSTSPVKKKINSTTNSPASPRRTPKQQKLAKLFEFQTGFHDSDSDDDLCCPEKGAKSPRTPKSKSKSGMIERNLFEGIKVKTPKKTRNSQDLSPNFITESTKMDRNTSENSRKSRDGSTTPDLMELAQPLDFSEKSFKSSDSSTKVVAKEITEKRRTRNSAKSSKPVFEIYSQVLPIEDLDDDAVSSSQPEESPSIFTSKVKRKSSQSTSKGTTFNKKSKFSIDTINILAESSP